MHRQPQVGIYWFLGRRLIVFTTPASNAATECGVRDYPSGHAEVWSEAQRLAPVGDKRENFQHARGRVLYVESLRLYRILGPSALQSRPLLIQQVVRRFGLRDSRHDFQADRHYDPPDGAEFED